MRWTWVHMGMGWRRGGRATSSCSEVISEVTAHATRGARVTRGRDADPAGSAADLAARRKYKVMKCYSACLESLVSRDRTTSDTKRLKSKAKRMIFMRLDRTRPIDAEPERLATRA